MSNNNDIKLAAIAASSNSKEQLIAMLEDRLERNRIAPSEDTYLHVLNQCMLLLVNYHVDGMSPFEAMNWVDQQVGNSIPMNIMAN